MTIIFIFVCAFAVYRIIVETNEANYLQNTQIVRPLCGFSVNLTFVLFFSDGFYSIVYHLSCGK